MLAVLAHDKLIMNTSKLEGAEKVRYIGNLGDCIDGLLQVVNVIASALIQDEIDIHKVDKYHKKDIHQEDHLSDMISSSWYLLEIAWNLTYPSKNAT
jgi:hypothetical protein